MRIPGRRVSQAEGTGSTEAGVCSLGGSGVSRGRSVGKEYRGRSQSA